MNLQEIRDIRALAKDRANARAVFEEKTKILKDVVILLVESGESEAEMSRVTGLARDIVRSWVGKSKKWMEKEGNDGATEKD